MAEMTNRFRRWTFRGTAEHVKNRPVHVPENALEVAPGVMAIAYPLEDGALRITWVSAVKEGSGDVGRWLDSLPTDTTVWVAHIVSERLAGMLARRGFVEAPFSNMVRRTH